MTKAKTPKKTTENLLRAVIHKDFVEELGQERCIQIVTKFGATQVARAIVDSTLSENATLSKFAQNWWVKWATDVFQATMEERLSDKSQQESVVSADNAHVHRMMMLLRMVWRSVIDVLF